jgi:hypothetical protein
MHVTGSTQRDEAARGELKLSGNLKRDSRNGARTLGAAASEREVSASATEREVLVMDFDCPTAT